jgi:HK97 family phage major capsid protein
MTIRDLLERRSSAVAQMRAITDAPAGKDGDLTDTQASEFTRLKDDLGNLEKRIERQQVVDDAERRVAAPAILTNGVGDGRYEDRAREFSLVKAINAALGEPVDAGFEREISAEVRARSGRPFIGIPVPDEIFLERRTLLTSGAASDLYPTQHRDDLFIDRLRSALVVGRLGATVLDNLVGDQEIPRQIASSVAQHVAEDAALGETDANFDDVPLSPRTVGAVTSFSRRTLINARPSIEQLIRRDLASVIANAIDFQALFGDGVGNTPTGVANQANVQAATLAGPTWAQVLDFIASIQADDADIGSMGWVTSPQGVRVLRSTNKVAAEPDHGFIMDAPDRLAGYGLITTSAVPVAVTTSAIFGAWSQLLVGYWSGTDLLLNPYEGAAYLRGRVLLRAMRDYDVAVRHGESFAVADNLTV